MVQFIAMLETAATMLGTVSQILSIFEAIGDTSIEIKEKILKLKAQYDVLKSASLTTWSVATSSSTVPTVVLTPPNLSPTAYIISQIVEDITASRGHEYGKLLMANLSPNIREEVSNYMTTMLYRPNNALIRHVASIANVLRSPFENRTLMHLFFLSAHMLQLRYAMFGKSDNTEIYLKKLLSYSTETSELEIPMLDIPELLELSHDPDDWYAHWEGADKSGNESGDNTGMFSYLSKKFEEINAWMLSSDDIIGSWLKTKLHDLEVIERRKGSDQEQLMINHIVTPNLTEFIPIYAKIMSDTYSKYNL